MSNDERDKQWERDEQALWGAKSNKKEKKEINAYRRQLLEAVVQVFRACPHDEKWHDAAQAALSKAYWAYAYDMSPNGEWGRKHPDPQDVNKCEDDLNQMLKPHRLQVRAETWVDDLSSQAFVQLIRGLGIDSPEISSWTIGI